MDDNSDLPTDLGKEPYSYPVGKYEEKLKQLILNITKPFANGIFDKFIEKSDVGDECICIQVCDILSIFQTESLKLELYCNGIIKLLWTEEKNLLSLDGIITKIIFFAYEKGIISLFLACQLLVSSMDFSLKIPINPEKIFFVREKMHQLDYKNMRDLLKLLLVEKFDKMQNSLTEYEHKQLAPIEELMIDLIDRKNNFCPALFFITEISRIQPQSPVYFLPRVSLKIREMVASFRPLAEIGSMIGRSWMYPITTQPSFSWFFSTWSTWKLQEQNYRLYFKTHLPYSSENMAPQTYLQYILLKQPRGQDNLLHMIRPSSSHSVNPLRLQCSEIVQILILEAMSAMEDSDSPVLMPSNQYNWLHLCHLISHALSIGCCTLQQLLPILQIQLEKYQYYKAKDELIWILLQFVANAKSKPSNMQTSYSKNQLDQKNIDLILDIFNLLYPEEMVWSGCSTDYLNMVRFFAPASLWINLSQISGCSSNVPPQNLQQHIEFLKMHLKSGIVPENGVLAIIANAYSNNYEVFETNVSRAILKILGAVPDPSSSFSNIPPWTLPHLRKADGCLVALDLPFLDSFTFHAKKMLYSNLLNYLQLHTQSGYLPSPALIETLCRILLTTDMNESNGKTFLTFFTQVCKDTQNQNYDLISICVDILNYRLQGMQLSVQYRAHIIFCVMEVMLNTSASNSSQQRAIYAKMEQVLMRQIMVASLLDFAHMAWILSSGKNCFNQTFLNFFVPPDKFGDYRQYGIHACPEIIRIFLLNLLRAHKVLASSSTYIVSELSFDYAQLARQNNYKWSNSTVKWFPCAFDVENNANFEAIQKNDLSSDEEVNSSAMDNYSGCYEKVTLFISVFKTICELSVFPISCYKILASMSAQNIIVNTNAFVEFIVWKSQSLKKAHEYEKLVLVVNEMIFVQNCIPFERFFLSLVLYPNDDTSIEYSLLLLSSLINQFNHLSQRIQNYCAFAPPCSAACYSKSEDYFTKLSEYYVKYPELTYLELIKRNVRSESVRESEKHLPIYYDNMPERILPIVDILLQRSLEIAVNPQILQTFLTTFSPLYKFHPQPMTFLYKTLYSLDSLGTFTHTHIARQFVMEIVQKIEEDRNLKYIVLSQEFFIDDYKMPVMKSCQVLVDRLIAASIYPHQPPSFVVRDWRFAEYPPAAQALMGAWIELMASSHSAKDVTVAIVELVMQRPINRPYDTINAVGLLLTGLPKSFQTVFFNRVVESFDWPQMLNGEPSMLFEPISQELYLYSESRILTMLALVHSFCQHAGNNSLSILPDLIADQLAPKVQNETQLIYFLRILVPYLQRINEKERQRHMNEYLKLILSIYNVLSTLVEKVGRLKYEDTVCDLLYQFKYMFVGYSLKTETEQVIEKFPKSMREKLKFLSTHSAADNSNQQQQQQHHHQQQHQHQMVMGHHSQLIHPQLAPFAAANSAGSIPPNHPMFLAAAGMFGNISIPVAPSHASQHQQATIPAAMSGVASSTAAALPGAAFPQQSASFASTSSIAPLAHSMSATPSTTANNGDVASSYSQVISSAEPQNVALNQTAAPKLLLSSSLSQIQLNTNDLPPPPPYSQHPMPNMSMSSAHVGSASTSQNSYLSTVNNMEGTSGVENSALNNSGNSGMPPANLMGEMSAFPSANGNEFGGFAEPVATGMNREGGGGIPHLQGSQFHHQQLMHHHQQQHNTNQALSSGNLIPTSGFAQHNMNFAPMPPQMFISPSNHMQNSVESSMAPTMAAMQQQQQQQRPTLHPTMLQQQAFSRQQQQMSRFPPNNQMM